MNELTQERSHIRASIVQSASVNHQAARHMNELTQEKSHTRASILQSVLPTHQTVRFMNELILERSHIHASIAQSASVSHQAAKKHEERHSKASPFTRKQHDRKLKLRTEFQGPAATLGDKKSCILSSVTGENSSQVESLTCWICLKEFDSEACVIQHYDEHMRSK